LTVLLSTSPSPAVIVRFFADFSIRRHAGQRGRMHTIPSAGATIGRKSSRVVGDAREYLAVVGSRSRDAVYLEAIEAVLVQRPELVHYRVLFGPPRHQVLKDHLLRLVKIRDPRDRSLGLKTLHIGIIDDDPGAPERFFCASESTAVVPIPSLTSSEAFDSGVLFEAAVAERLIDHGRQCYAGARKMETGQVLRDLPTVRS
jgi:hypothetical protein